MRLTLRIIEMSHRKSTVMARCRPRPILAEHVTPDKVEITIIGILNARIKACRFHATFTGKLSTPGRLSSKDKEAFTFPKDSMATWHDNTSTTHLEHSSIKNKSSSSSEYKQCKDTVSGKWQEVTRTISKAKRILPGRRVGSKGRENKVEIEYLLTYHLWRQKLW